MQDAFTKLFKYIEEFRQDVTERLDTKASQQSVNTLTNSVDGYSKKTDKYFQKMIMLSHKVGRLET